MPKLARSPLYQPAIGGEDPYPLHRQLIRECRAMTLYAMSIGRRVPGALLEALEPDVSSASVQTFANDPNGSASFAADGSPNSENGAFAPVPRINIQQLSALHGQLCDIVAPAKPRTICLLEEEQQRAGPFRFLGSVGLTRRMMMMAALCMTLFVSLAITPYVMRENMGKNLLDFWGLPLFFVILFLLSTAGLGASFNALFTANRYVQEGTYDPIYETSYWTRFVLGLMAGLILSQLVPISEAAKTGHPDFTVLSKPVLALLGGFSASLVYRVLTHLLTSVETLVRSDSRELRKANEQLDRVRATETENSNRLQLLGKLSALRQNLQSNLDPKAILVELERLQQQIALNSPLDTPSREALAVAPAAALSPKALLPEALLPGSGSAPDGIKAITTTPSTDGAAAVVRS